MVGFRKSSSSGSAKALDTPKMKDDTLSSQPPFLFNAVDTDYPISRERNEMAQQEGHDLFPRFSQSEADRWRVQDVTVRNYLSKTPVDEFREFNEHHIDTNGEVYDHRKYAEGKFIEKENENGEKQNKKERARLTVLNNSQSLVDNMKASDSYGAYQCKDSMISQRALKWFKERYHINEKEKDKVKGEKSEVFPNFFHGSEDPYKDLDEYNIETDEENDKNDKSWYKLSGPSLLRRGRTKEADEPQVFPFFDLTASGNVPTEKVSDVRGNPNSPLATDMKGGRANGFREERRGFRYMGGFIPGGKGLNIGMRNGKCVAGKDLRMWKSTPRKPVANTGSDRPFQTEVSYSLERDGEIIESERVTDNISVIHKMFKAPPEEPKSRMLEPIRRKTGTLPSMSKRIWSQSMNNAELKKAGKAKGSERVMGLAKLMGLDKAKILEKAKEIERVEKPPMELTDNELTSWHRQETLQFLVGDSLGEDVEAILRNSPKGGTKDLENQVYRMTSDVPHLRTCFIAKANSVRSVRPIIENDSEKARRVNMAQERATELQRTGHCPSPIQEEDEQGSFQPCRHPEQFFEPSSSNNPTDQTSHSYNHPSPMSEAALEDSSPFEVPGPFSKPRPSPLRNKSIDEMINSEERGLPVLEHTTKESPPTRRHLKRFGTPISPTGKGTDSQSNLVPKEQANPETSTSTQTKKLHRLVKSDSLRQKFMKGFEK
ncbi:predicted protein [Sclerotinia sclerotiorum 1980 UF-70]|uniref:Uncharacterized protein n=2 Tax=Sclerotinia sclerotiorum (strain ATCC 18683 / 1980 / Ss-1) TaxID=665079 RepID=A7F4T2_SCLS1|nr:predicted protein [Sclerotinia sclerotiorum 1980 UF-70]APA10585.1 hypothetical protein sscle_06g053550 [Sclerotinia sclerotiorum 1980 UF-70]EDN97753.1 predicted protein [Sclerotinia sclerotiorum 1980 UF-70]